MDITATGGRISGKLYQQKGAGARTQDTDYLKAAREAGSRLQQKEPKVLNITMMADPAAGIYQQYQQRQASLDMRDRFPGKNREGASEDPWQVIAARKEEIEEKLRNGDTEVKYQIGAGSYTEKEWERMMEQFDSLEEIIRHMMEERREKQRQYAFRQALGGPEAKEASS